jgi:hypothetical protein
MHSVDTYIYQSKQMLASRQDCEIDLMTTCISVKIGRRHNLNMKIII